MNLLLPVLLAVIGPRVANLLVLVTFGMTNEVALTEAVHVTLVFVLVEVFVAPSLALATLLVTLLVIALVVIVGRHV